MTEDWLLARLVSPNDLSIGIRLAFRASKQSLWDVRSRLSLFLSAVRHLTLEEQRRELID